MKISIRPNINLIGVAKLVKDTHLSFIGSNVLLMHLNDACSSFYLQIPLRYCKKTFQSLNGKSLLCYLVKAYLQSDSD